MMTGPTNEPGTPGVRPVRRIAARSLDEVGGFLAERAADAPMAAARPAKTTTKVSAAR